MDPILTQILPKPDFSLFPKKIYDMMYHNIFCCTHHETKYGFSNNYAHKPDPDPNFTRIEYFSILTKFVENIWPTVFGGNDHKPLSVFFCNFKLATRFWPEFEINLPFFLFSTKIAVNMCFMITSCTNSKSKVGFRKWWTQFLPEIYSNRIFFQFSKNIEQKIFLFVE